MKLFIAFVLLYTTGLSVSAQYYYKDIILAGQTAARWKQYKENKVKKVTVNSFEVGSGAVEGFACEQDVSGDFSRIITHTRSSQTTESWLTVYYSGSGLPVKTIDTSDTYRSTTEYQFDAAGHIMAITNTSVETDNHLKETEEHLWKYDAQGMPSGMLKIKNGSDTTFVRFTTDEKGNIAEEHSTRKNKELPTVYYYYDAAHHLTDIVRYNLKAQKLLPDYIFEYDEANRLISMLIVPEGTSDYMKWLYSYNEKGLKIKEACFNKQKQLLGSIEYQYASS